jgi:hypothetical protein
MDKQDMVKQDMVKQDMEVCAPEGSVTESGLVCPRTQGHNKARRQLGTGLGRKSDSGGILMEHDLIGNPVATFPDHALAQ